MIRKGKSKVAILEAGGQHDEVTLPLLTLEAPLFETYDRYKVTSVS